MLLYVYIYIYIKQNKIKAKCSLLIKKQQIFSFDAISTFALLKW